MTALLAPARVASELGCVTYQALELNGRLGNQLWQLAWVIGESQRRQWRPAVHPDWTYRPYFSLPDSFFDAVPKGAERCDGGADYFQELRYFAEAQTLVRRYFQPRDTTQVQAAAQALRQHGAEVLCAVHVRRGDYLKLGAWFPLATRRYYQAAVARIKQRHAQVHFVVFSDDMAWCLNEIDFFGFAPGDSVSWMTPEVTPIDPALRGKNPGDQDDLFLMSRCDEHIISNSTFAWWGAWLSANPQPCYPSVWYGPGCPLYPRWHQSIPAGWQAVAC